MVLREKTKIHKLYFKFVPDSGTSWNMDDLKEQTAIFLTKSGYPVLWDERKSFSKNVQGRARSDDYPPRPGGQIANEIQHIRSGL